MQYGHQRVRLDTPSDTPTNMPLGSVSRIRRHFANIRWLRWASLTIRLHGAHAASRPGTSSRSAFIPHPHFTHTHPLRVSMKDTEQQEQGGGNNNGALSSPNSSGTGTDDDAQMPPTLFLPTNACNRGCL